MSTILRRSSYLRYNKHVCVKTHVYTCANQSKHLRAKASVVVLRFFFWLESAPVLYNVYRTSCSDQANTQKKYTKHNVIKNGN